MNRKVFLAAAIAMSLALGAQAAVTAFFSATPDCAGPSPVGFAPAGPSVQASMCVATDFESVCGATFQLQAASAAENDRFRIIARTLFPPYDDPNAPFITYPVSITNPAQTVDFGGTVSSGTPPTPGTTHLVATFTLQPQASATNASYSVGLSAISNVAIDGTDCFAQPHDQTISATLTLTRNDLNPDPVRLANISTRGQVQTGFDVMIGGFVVSGANPKTVVIRALGPSLANFGVSGALPNPTLQLVRVSDGSTVATNDDWGSAPNAAQIQSANFAPSHALESAIMTTLAPGAYTALVSGVGGSTGVGLVEVYEVDQPATPLINISTRGKVQTGFDVMIGGFVVQGSGSQTVIVRAIGPSLAQFGITGALQNPTIQLVRISDNTTIATNDDWQSAPNVAQIQSSGFAPSHPQESAILITLQPGAYTAIVSGVNGGTGTGLIEVYKVGQ
jgi:hypothetical protein